MTRIVAVSNGDMIDLVHLIHMFLTPTNLFHRLQFVDTLWEDMGP